MKLEAVGLKGNAGRDEKQLISPLLLTDYLLATKFNEIVIPTENRYK